MKKLLFSCLLATGIGVSAQFDYTAGFEGTDADPATAYGQFGGGTMTAAAACTGSFGGQLTTTSAITQTGWMVMMDETGQTGNGQKVDVTAKYKKGATVAGSISLAYFVYNDDANNWTIYLFGTPVTLTASAITTCSSLSGTIPAGTLQPDKTYGIGVWFTKSGSANGNIFTDDIVIKQEVVTTPPACTTFTGLTNGTVVSGGNYRFSWASATGAANYKLTVGTTSGGSDVLNTVVAGTYYDANLPVNGNYYAKVVPSNNVGDASGCSEVSFSTNSNVAHCGPLSSTAPTAIAPIKSVSFSGVTNPSDTSATTIGTFSPYESFTSIEFPVKNDVTTVPLTIQGTTNGNTANGWAMSVFIDWNNDGDFDDAGEQYFNTAATKVIKGGVTDNPITLAGNITIPTGVAVGKKTMRIKYNFSSTAASAPNTPLLTACADMINGQAEDYTIDYQQALAVSDVNKAGLSVYPNPFHDVLKISDVKNVKSISINDVSGRQVKTLAPAAEINLANLKDGLYIVNLQMQDGSVKSIKAIKK